MEDDGKTGRLVELIDRAVCDAMADEEDGMAVKWLAIVEMVGPDGQRALWTLCPDTTTSWDSLGMLTYAKTVEESAIRHAGES